tara:strand:- start:1918 stop:2952 length:1035 start_codon:yes stop_codon:yes gene_type:complete
LGESVYNLERKLAKYVGVKECITCASGTDALLIPLMGHGITNGDAVFTTNFSYFATTEVVSLVGASPVFIDIDKKTFNIDPEKLEFEIKNILDKGELKPKAIIAVDIFGQLADYSKLIKIAKKYNLFLIEDAAQSFGATYKKNKSCSFGNVAATSFFPAKPLGCYGDGGAIFTNDRNLAELYRSIRVHGQGEDKYDNVRIGLNSRLDTLQAIVLLNKLDIFDEELVLRNNIANFYSNNLKDYLKTPIVLEDNISSWAQYSLLAKDENERNKLVNFLNNNGIPSVIYYKKLFSDLNIYKKFNKSENFNISRSISERIFSIPMHPYLTKNELNKIINNLHAFFKND